MMRPEVDRELRGMHEKTIPAVMGLLRGRDDSW